METEESWPPFGSDEFLGALRDVYFPRARIAVVECEGVRVRTLVQAKSKAVSGFFPFAFYLEPIERPREAIPVRFIADVVASVAGIDELRPPGMGISPFVDWTGVESWDAYLASRVSPPGVDSVTTIQRKARRLERDLGPMQLRLVDGDEGVFEQLLRWKSEQYRRTGGIDRLAVPQNVEFYRVLRERGLFVTSSFRAGDVLLGGKIGVRAGGRHVSRLTVYDPAFADFSPGSIMDMETLRASYESGDAEFDFLMGAEPYKYTWATHARWLSKLGQEPRLERLTRSVRARVGRTVGRRRGYGTYKEGVRMVRAALRRL